MSIVVIVEPNSPSEGGQVAFIPDTVAPYA